jgi:hypothetical protein
MTRKMRTAVLVVHGMGSQRPLETVRGVVDAVWFDNDDHYTSGKRVWSHPEPSGADLDLTVMTTTSISGKPGDRVADFHELYWAHLMSETKPVAVLLWLFELGRRGPNFKTGMNGLWWCGAVYLCLLLLSVALIALRGVVWVANIADAPEGILITLFLMLSVAILVSLIASAFTRWWRLCRRLVVGFAGWVIIGMLAVGAAWLVAWWANLTDPNLNLTRIDSAKILTGVLLPIGIAFVAARLLMAKWGARAFGVTLLASLAFFLIYFVLVHFGFLGKPETLVAILRNGRIPWSLYSDWSVVAAWIIIGGYLAINAAFLQPYLGDAARYFRNSPANVAVRRAIRKEAVDTLDKLHRSRDYDRIVVVAHSLGTAVAYDMLRAYYSRICSQIPVNKSKLNPEFDAIDGGTLDCASLRVQARELIRKLVHESKILADPARQKPCKSAKSDEVDVWLVTDFVTLGSPLTHARYLMINDDNADRLDEDFSNHVRERELLLCPPYKLDIDPDGLISFKISNEDGTESLRLHHGGMFGLTRWTNLYFKVTNIFWGDAIGGQVAPVFGGCVNDVQVWTDKAHTDGVFTHTSYWKTECADGRDAPHIKALRDAIDLPDEV